MSGINPILDTLLHQVLGRRAPPLPAPHAEPVRPMNAADAPLAVRSDSRLDPRPLPVTFQSGDEPRAPLLARAPKVASAPSSALTHFSPAARAIADILVRYPAPPSFVQPQGPLVKDGDSATLAQLAGRLRDTIQHSGLFYQAHLARWFRGELPLAALAQEPQMQLTRPVLARRLAQYTQASPPPVEAAQSRSQDSAPLSPRINDSLQGLLRHQLEVLAAPVLNWQGEVWAGWSLSLSLGWLPHPGDEAGFSEQSAAHTPPRDWELSVKLDSQALGAVHIRLRERRGNLAVLLMCQDTARVEQLRRHGGVLHGALAVLGFNSTRVRIIALPAAEQASEQEA